MVITRKNIESEIVRLNNKLVSFKQMASESVPLSSEWFELGTAIGLLRDEIDFQNYLLDRE